MTPSKGKQYALASLLPLTLAAAGIASGPLSALLPGLARILTSPAILLSDFTAAGGLPPALLNAGLLGLLSLFFLALLKIDLSGPFLAAVYTVTGFGLFGKNLLNVWPVLAGVWLYARVQGVPFRNYALVALFGTTLSPLVSVLAFGPWLSLPAAVPAALLFGLAAGFVLPPLASHMLRFHDGYNIYNVGFTGGIAGSFLVALLRGFGFVSVSAPDLTPADDGLLKFLLIALSSAAVLAGILYRRRNLKALLEETRKIYASTGRLVSDFTVIGSLPAAAVNMGVMGLVASLFVVLLGGSFNGPVAGAVITVAGFGAFGKHPKNSIPILAGVYLAASLKVWETQATSVIIAGLFGTTLAPIAGSFGVLAGVLAGFFHLSIVHNVGVLHGGVNLYNNGFAGGFVASFMVPIINGLSKKERNQ